MADIRIKDLATTATTTASDDFMAVDGATNGTRKMNAAAPAFLTSVTTPSLTSPAGIDLTLAGGSSGASLVLGQGTTAADITFTPKGNGEFKWTGSTFRQTAVSPNSTGYVIPGYATGTNPDAGSSRGADINLINLSATDQNGAALTFSNSNQLSSAYIFGQNLSHAGRTGNIIFGTANGSSPTERMRIASSGTVSISSSTAGSAGAGALVVTGGLSAGAASYFAGAVTLASSNPSLTLSGTSGKLLLTDTGVGSTSRNWAIGYSQAAEGDFLIMVSTAAGGDPILGTTALGFDRTGAATFAGAVSVSGTAATFTSGTGSPESVKTAPVGSLYTRTDGGASTTLYVKESGAGNTGWIAK